MKDTIIRLRCAGAICIGGPVALASWCLAFVSLLLFGCGMALMARAAGDKRAFARDPLAALKQAQLY